MLAKLRHIPYWGGLALLVYMPFHIFLSQSLSLLTGGLEVWKGAKDVLTFLVLIAAVLTAAAQRRKVPKYYWYLVLMSSAYGFLHLLLYVINKDTSFSVALLATAYNCRLFGYLIIGATAALFLPKKIDTDKLIKLVLIISTVVAVLGILQYVLPKDILTHVGYAKDRGVKPNFFINEDSAFPRVMSTIRDPNSLGAFLLIPIVLLVQRIAQKAAGRKRLIGGLLALHLLALYLSFSRAAWGGLVIALGLLFYLSHRDKVWPFMKRFWPVAAGLVIVVSLAGYTVRDTQFVRSVVFRIDDKNPETQPDSDELHLDSVQKGAEGVAEKPLGYGPGTAGIVSIQNERGSFLTENYYVQIAHEVGVLGLAIFLAIFAYTLRLLLRNRTAIGQALIATAGAYAVMSLVMHLWTNEAVAAQWWMLAGVMLVPAIRNSHNRERTT